MEALRLEEDRQAYLLCVEGSVQITDGKGQVHELNQHDGCELKGAMDLAPHGWSAWEVKRTEALRAFLEPLKAF